MAEIAKAVGMTRQSVYLHFGTRGGLLVALVRRADVREAIVEDFTAALKARSPETRLDACLTVWFAFVVKIHPVALDLIRLRTTDKEAARAWDDRMEELLRLFRLLVEGLKRDKALARQWSVQSAVDYLWAACSVQTWALLVLDRGWSEKQASATMRRAMAKALLA